MLPKMVPAEASKKEELHRRLRRMQKEKGDPQGQCLGERFGGTGQIFTDERFGGQVRYSPITGPPQESFCNS